MEARQTLEHDGPMYEEKVMRLTDEEGALSLASDGFPRLDFQGTRTRLLGDTGGSDSDHLGRLLSEGWCSSSCRVLQSKESASVQEHVFSGTFGFGR